MSLNKTMKIWTKILRIWNNTLRMWEFILFVSIPLFRKHDMSVVMLESRDRKGVEDIYPSLIAISWHGSDYETTLRQRNKECEEFCTFLMLLREKNWHIPILVGKYILGILEVFWSLALMYMTMLQWPQCTIHWPQCTIHWPQCTIQWPQCTLYNTMLL